MWPWYVTAIALVVGVAIGFFLFALICANGRSDPRD